jgi:hypothetical protein
MDDACLEKALPPLFVAGACVQRRHDDAARGREEEIREEGEDGGQEKRVVEPPSTEARLSPPFVETPAGARV